MAAAKKTKDATAAKAAEAVRPEGAPKFVRLSGIAAFAGGKLLPVGKSLEVGVDIPASLAEARVAAETAEWVKDTAITAQALRDAVKDLVERGRRSLTDLLARVEAASDADLADLVEPGGNPPSDEDRAAADALAEAMDAHRAALETEAAAGPEDGKSAE